MRVCVFMCLCVCVCVCGGGGEIGGIVLQISYNGE